MSSTTISATQATLPSASIGTALDGGLGYHDLFDRNAYTYVEVGPLSKAQPNDTVTVLWAGSAVVLHSVTIEDLTQGTFPIAVLNGKIADAGDGDKVLSYTATYTQGGGEEYSEPVLVKVKRVVPGGLDPHPGTPDINENLPAASVAPDPVPVDATQVTITAPLWLNPALGDVMVVAWNGANFFAPSLTAPFPDAVSVTLTAAEVLDAGVGPAVPVTWGVHDVVANWSGWAPETAVDVRLEDPGLFLAPRVGDKDVPWTQIDLVALGSADLVVFTPDYEGAVAGDQVIVHTHGIAFDGQTHTYDTPAQTMPEPGYGMTFTVPNATAVALAGGTLRVWYTVEGKPVPESHSVWLPVLGQATGDLPAPVIAEASDSDGNGTADQLDPDVANPAHVTVDYPSMLAFDTVTLIWDGRSANGMPVHYEVDRQVSTVAPLTVIVTQAEILKFLDGDADVYYRVVPFSARGKTFARALATRESARLPLRIRHVGVEQPLPAPSVDEVVNGFLDPAAEQATLRAPLYPDITKGDEITYSWVGSVSTRTQTYKVADATKPPPDYADRDFIVQNTGTKVTVSYSVKRLGVDPGVPSETAEFRIDLAESFDIDPSMMTLAPDDTQVRTATGGVPPYHYVSANSALATVNGSTGLVTAKAEGQTTITASDAAGQSASYSVKVTAAFYIDPSLMNLAPDEDQLRTATGGAPPYSYVSSKPTVATAAASGLVSAKKQGQTTITASDAAGQSASYTVKVTAAFDIDPSVMTLAPDETQVRTATGGTPPYSYVSSKPAVATAAASGLVTAKSQGTTTIKASDAAGHSASYNVKVTEAFAIDPTTMKLVSGSSETRTATGGTPPYQYASSNTGIALVNTSTGLVTAKAAGKASITARDALNTPGRYGYDVVVRHVLAIEQATMVLEVDQRDERQATGGTPPYAYTTSNVNVVAVGVEGHTLAFSPGTATITARDSENDVVSYGVKVVAATQPLNIDQSPVTIHP